MFNVAPIKLTSINPRHRICLGSMQQVWYPVLARLLMLAFLCLDVGGYLNLDPFELLVKHLSCLITLCPCNLLLMAVAIIMMPASSLAAIPFVMHCNFLLLQCFSKCPNLEYVTVSFLSNCYQSSANLMVSSSVSSSTSNLASPVSFCFVTLIVTCALVALLFSDNLIVSSSLLRMWLLATISHSQFVHIH